MAIEKQGYTPFPLPITGPVTSKAFPLDAASQGANITLGGTSFSVRVQVSNATNPGPQPDHLFIPPDASFDTSVTLTAADPPQQIAGPVRFIRLILDSGTLTGANIEQNTRGSLPLDTQSLGQLASTAGTAAGTAAGKAAGTVATSYATRAALAADTTLANGARAYVDGSWWSDSSSGTADGYMTLAMPGGRYRVREVTGALNVQWFGADPTGGADSTAAFNRACTYAATLGRTVFVPVGRYLITGTVTVPGGVGIEGESWTLDPTNAANRVGPVTGVVYLMRGSPQFKLYGGARFLKGCMYYDQQNYVLETVDDAVTVYPATFLQAGLSGAEIGYVTYIGGSVIMDTADDANPQKLYVHDIWGCAFQTWIRIRWVSEVPKLRTFHGSVNSIGGAIRAQLDVKHPGSSDAVLDIYTNRLVERLAKTVTFLDMGRVDDIDCSGLFVFGVRNFYVCSSFGVSGDTGAGWGAALTNCSGDLIYEGFNIGRRGGGFGLRVSNSFFTPLTYINGSDPVLVTLGTGATSDNALMFTNVKVFGTTIVGLNNTASAVRLFRASPGLGRNEISLSNFVAEQMTTELASSAFVLAPSTAASPRLTLASTTLNGRQLSSDLWTYDGQILGTGPSADTVVGFVTFTRRVRVRTGSISFTGTQTGGNGYVRFVRLGQNSDILLFTMTSGATTGTFSGDVVMNPGEVLEVHGIGLNTLSNLRYHIEGSDPLTV